MSPPAKALATVAAMVALAAALAPGAQARSVYAVSYDGNQAAVLDAVTGQVAGPLIPVPGGPFTLAISPDGKTVYAVDYIAEKVSAIDTATNQISGPEMQVGTAPYGISVTPDGTRAYVVNASDNNVSVFDLQSRQPIGTPIEVGNNPNEIAITPDGKRAYVTNEAGGSVSVLDLATNQVVGTPIKIPTGDPYGIAVTPDGSKVFVGTTEGAMSMIDTATNQVVGAPIPTPGSVEVAITPDGKQVYATDYKSGSVSIYDVATGLLQTPAIAGLGTPEYLAFSPDGTRLYMNEYDNEKILTLDTATRQLLGAGASIGENPGEMAAVPDQSPTASLTPPTARVRPGVPVTLSGAASSDSDGTIATYAWQFGDGGTATGAASSAAHTYPKPGEYKATLTLTDNEGCSVALVYTGSTAYCHGSPAAAQSQTVLVKYPGVKVKCPKKAGAKGCKFKLKAVKKTGKGKKKKVKAESAVAKAKVKAGKSAIVSLKPKKNAASKLATAKKLLVQQDVTIDGETTTKVGKLKIVQ